MSAFGYHDGQRATVSFLLANGNATTLLNGSTRRYHIASVRMINHSGSTVNPVIDVYDGTTTKVFRGNKDLTDTSDETIDMPGGFLVLDANQSLRITAAANVSVFVAYVDPYKNTGDHG